MLDKTYRVTEIVGSSGDGFEKAIRNGLDRAAATLRHLDWFQVTEIRGHIDDGRAAHYQVTMKLGFRLDIDYAADEKFRVLQFIPRNSEASIIFGRGITSAKNGRAGSLVLAVDDRNLGGSADRRLVGRIGARRTS